MTILGTVGIADKGTYSPTATYKKGNFVLYNGSSWLALQDDLTGVEPVEGANWKYLARGFLTELLSEVSATDTQGLLGVIGATVTGQALIDELADRVATKLLPKVNVVNNQTTNVEGYALDARQGNPTETDSLAYQISSLNSNLGNGRYSEDLMIAQPTTALLYWDGNTLNTPFKDGMTGAQQGAAIVTGDYGTFQTVIAVDKGDNTIFMHSTNNGVPSGWVKVPLNSDLIKTILIQVDITTQTTAGVALGAGAYQQVITSDGVLAGKTVLGACVESVQNIAAVSEIGIGAINTSNGYVYINTLTAGTYAVRVRVYYK